MSLESRIVAALLAFDLPVRENVYTGKAEKYFTFNYNIHGDDYGNNRPQHEIAMVQLHFFCPDDYHEITSKSIKQRLYEAGFGWPDMINASDEDGQHWVFEFEAVEGVDIL